MNQPLTQAQLTGQGQDHLTRLPDGHQLHPEAAAAFQVLQERAAQAGFSLAIASSYRSYDRQLAIFNGKASGERPVSDDRGALLSMEKLSPTEQLAAILRFSALPGTSRHHWGTDLDIYDAAAVDSDYRVQLSPQEVGAGGVFDPVHCWLDDCMRSGESEGFFRPYNRDRGGVAPERWHLSYAPVSTQCVLPEPDQLLQLWRSTGLLLLDEIEGQLAELFARYVEVAKGWCDRQ